jgi:hypothetical protein
MKIKTMQMKIKIENYIAEIIIVILITVIAM